MKIVKLPMAPGEALQKNLISRAELPKGMFGGGEKSDYSGLQILLKIL